MPGLTAARREVASGTPRGLTGRDQVEAVKHHLAALDQVKAWEPILYPEDDRG